MVAPRPKLLALLLTLALLPLRAQDARVDYTRLPTEKLIATLADIDSRAPGIDSAVFSDGFIAQSKSLRFEGGVLGIQQTSVPVQMRELVRRGPAALPDLLRHLDDRTPTKLVVGNISTGGGPRQVGVNLFMFTEFGAEYDPRLRDFSIKRGSATSAPGRDFQGSYTVKVGDICFALVGQIVNRRLLAVRYQPSAGLIVNSPLEQPSLAARTRSDWGDGNADLLRSSLLADIRLSTGRNDDWSYFKEQRKRNAFPRLSLYFPEAYASLTGADLKKRKSFEAEEHKAEQAR